MGRMIRRRSKIETEMPADLRQEVDRLLLEGATYKDVTMYCNARGFDIGKSTVGRYGKAFFEAYQNVKRFEDQSRVMQSEVGEGMLLEEATTKMLLQKVMAVLIDGSFDVLELPRILSDVAKLQSSSVQREKIKADFKKEMEKKIKTATNKVAEEAKKRGVPDDTIDYLKEKMLGVIKQ